MWPNALSQHQMVFLMVCADRHHAEEAKRVNSNRIPINDQGHAIVKFFGRDIPTCFRSQERRVGRHNGADGLKNTLSSTNLESGSFGAMDDVNFRFRGQQVHVDEVSTESGYVDRAPVGFRVISEDRHDFGQSGKAGLAGLLWTRHRVDVSCVAVLSERRGCKQKGQKQDREAHRLILRKDDVVTL